MLGNAALVRSRSWWRGYRRGFRSVYRRRPGWGLILSWLLSGMLLVFSGVVTWTAVDLALKNVAGEEIQKTTIGKWAAWWKVMGGSKHP